ncbi:MAG: nuclear transport factor 2 family protein [Caulobacterales bacterium]
MANVQETNKLAVIRYFIEVLQNQDVSLIPQLLAPNYTFNGQPASVDGNKKFVAFLQEQYPGFRYDIIQAFAMEDRVILAWRLNAPAITSGPNARPSGTIMGSNFVTGANGMAVSNWQVSEPFVPDPT